MYLVSSEVYQKYKLAATNKAPSKIKRNWIFPRKVLTIVVIRWVKCFGERTSHVSLGKKTMRNSWIKFYHNSQYINLNEWSNNYYSPSVPVKLQVVESLQSIVAVHESTPRKQKFEIYYEEKDNVEEEVSDFGRENFVELTSPYLKPYLYRGRFLSKNTVLEWRTTAVLWLVIPHCPLTTQVISP